MICNYEESWSPASVTFWLQGEVHTVAGRIFPTNVPLYFTIGSHGDINDTRIVVHLQRVVSSFSVKRANPVDPGSEATPNTHLL